MTKEAVIVLVALFVIVLYIIQGFFRQRIPQCSRPEESTLPPQHIPEEIVHPSVHLLVSQKDDVPLRGEISDSEIGKHVPKSEKNRSFNKMRHALIGYEIFSLPLSLRSMRR